MRIRRRQIQNNRLEADKDYCLKFFPTQADKKVFQTLLFTIENLYYREGYEHGWADRDGVGMKIEKLVEKFKKVKEAIRKRREQKTLPEVISS